MPGVLRSIIEADLRELVALEHSSPREHVTFVAHIHPSFTYRALAKDAAHALGSPGCADDSTLTSLRMQLDPEQATSGALVQDGNRRNPGFAEVVRDGVDVAVMGPYSAADLITVAQSLSLEPSGND